MRAERLVVALIVLAATPRLPPAKAATPPAPRDAARDPFVGNYVGTFHPLGTYEVAPKPDDHQTLKTRNCGHCHAEATIDRTQDGSRDPSAAFRSHRERNFARDDRRLAHASHDDVY